MRWLDDITDSMHMSVSKLRKTVPSPGRQGNLHAAVRGVQRVRHNLVTEQ